MASNSSSVPLPLPELSLAPGALAIADLHLDPASGEPTAFLRFLERAARAPQLFVLGDLFDVWVGPAQANAPGTAVVLDALAACTRGGTHVAIVPGNRDFLLDARFRARTGVHLYDEGFVGRCEDGARWLAVHGDSFCTRDTGYLRLRRVVRSRAVRALAPRLPLFVGALLARRLRRASVRALRSKLPEAKSMQASAVLAGARAHGCAGVVCGHAHEFRDEQITGGPRWIVLAAFGAGRDVLAVGRGGAVTTQSSATV
ncbi:MAG: UDP-2,3-diacylglucosamine diphosphatase [Planctomycetota bacterium]